MVSLSRTVRFTIGEPIDPARPASGPNGYAGVPAFAGLARHYELTVTCAGDVSPLTGYFLNIKDIDAAVRAHALPRIAAACGVPGSNHALGSAGDAPALVLRRLIADLAPPLRHTVRGLRWALTPYHSLEMHAADTRTVELRQKFEFAASHRLHAATLSEAENRALFGKCNHPSGHGHNYVIEPRVAVRVDDRGLGRPSLPEIESIVDRVVIQRYDHKHLNLDLPEFATQGGVNPSVENIAKVCFERLVPEITAAGGTLRAVTVWETEKTCCTYGG
jgi:6-pyruvoyltetrahydropterin/6-carboxytetrahydropterin synthase